MAWMMRLPCKEHSNAVASCLLDGMLYSLLRSRKMVDERMAPFQLKRCLSSCCSKSRFVGRSSGEHSSKSLHDAGGGCISASTGTNFLIRAAAFKQAGWSPEFTLTEDFALGMLLKMHKWHCRYVEEYLAVGEAPDEVRNCFQQRSRWCKVCLQVIAFLCMQVCMSLALLF